MTRKITFFEGWSWFKFNNLGLALSTNLKFCTSVAKGLKLKLRKFWGPNPTFVEVTGEKLVGGAFLASLPSWIGLKALQDLSSMRFTPGSQLQRQLNYTKCLVLDVVSNAQNMALKKLKMDSNSRNSPGHIIKGDKKDIANYRSNWLLNLHYKTYTANS